MLLFELFTKPNEWETDEDFSDNEEYAATFHTKDGREFQVYIHTRAYEPQTYEVEFSPEKAQGKEGRFGTTGKGSEIEIFSTVVDVMSKFLQNNPDKVLYFSAQQKNRASLYDRMLKRFVKPPFTVYSQELLGSGGAYWIGKPEQVKAAVERDLGDDE